MNMTEAEFNNLNDTQKKALQQKLKDDGLYFGTVDGKWGKGTETAIKLSEKAAAGKVSSEADAAVKKAGAAKVTAETEALESETAAKKLYQQQSQSTEGLLTSGAANIGAPLAGVAAGRGMGAGINKLMDMSQERKNATLAAAAQDRIRGLTTRKGAQSGTTISGAMPSRNSVLRVGGRMLPHAITGAGMAGKGAAMLTQGNEDDPYYTQMANRGAGLGMIGTGVGIAERGANYAITPGVPPDARSIAIIESEGLRRNNAAPPPPSGPKPGSLTALKQEARDLQIPGRSKLRTVGALQSAIENARQGAKALPKSGVLAPLSAATIAYNATRSPAEAGQEGGSRAEAATNAAAAGGAAAGTVALAKRYAPRVLGALARMSGPLGLAEGAGEIQKRLNQPGASARSVVGDMYTEGFGKANDAFGKAMADFMDLLASGKGPDQAAGPYTP